MEKLKEKIPEDLYNYFTLQYPKMDYVVNGNSFYFYDANNGYYARNSINPINEDVFAIISKTGNWIDGEKISAMYQFEGNWYTESQMQSIIKLLIFS